MAHNQSRGIFAGKGGALQHSLLILTKNDSEKSFCFLLMLIVLSVFHRETKSCARSATPSPRPETWGASICKEHNPASAPPSVHSSILLFFLPPCGLDSLKPPWAETLLGHCLPFVEADGGFSCWRTAAVASRRRMKVKRVDVFLCRRTQSAKLHPHLVASCCWRWT